MGVKYWLDAVVKAEKYYLRRPLTFSGLFFNGDDLEVLENLHADHGEGSSMDLA